jgi:uncharacterized protein (TIGR03086 family)
MTTKDGTTLLDLGPAAWQMAALIGSTPDTMLGAPTPCPDYTVGDLIEHVGGLSIAFSAAAAKADLDGAGTAAPSGDASRLAADWRTSIPRAVNAMADAWRDPDAWTGMTRAGGVELPGEVGGLVALDELLLHGWDLARSLGRPYNCDETSIAAVHGFVSQFSGPGQEEARAGLFGPEVDVDPGAPLLHRVVGLAGRDPSWSQADVS